MLVILVIFFKILFMFLRFFSSHYFFLGLNFFYSLNYAKLEFLNFDTF